MNELESLLEKSQLQHIPDKFSEMRRASAARMKRARRWRRWFIRGIIIGAAWAILSAPEPGWQTRHKVGKFLNPAYQQGKVLLSRLRDQQERRNSSNRPGLQRCVINPANYRRDQS